jgi:hypothetical protein
MPGLAALPSAARCRNCLVDINKMRRILLVGRIAAAVLYCQQRQPVYSDCNVPVGTFRIVRHPRGARRSLHPQRRPVSDAGRPPARAQRRWWSVARKFVRRRLRSGSSTVTDGVVKRCRNGWSAAADAAAARAPFGLHAASAAASCVRSCYR